jgi:hypothetical protein
MSERFEEAVRRFDEENARDSQRVELEGRQWPGGLVYARRMTEWLGRLEPGASEVVKLAARGQHIRRWEIPRESYPMDRVGYLKWRTDLGKFHARVAGEILSEVGYDGATVARVGALLRKENIKGDPEAQLLEDVICLVFFENYVEEFARGKDEAKLAGIVGKVWKKMSGRGRAAAMGIAMSPEVRAVVETALRQ